MTHAVFVTSWQLTMGQGSGTALFVRSLQNALQATDTQVDLLNPLLDTRDYTQFTLERFWYNTQLIHNPLPAQADWVLGIDYDGYALPRRPNQRFIGTARAVFADLIETEPEPFRTLLRAQAFFEAHNLRNSELVITPSTYACRKVTEYYGIPPEKVHAVPNGINLTEWDALRATLPIADPNRPPTVLAVSKLYPRKKINTLIRAIPILRHRFPDVQVRIVGGGFEWDVLHQLSRALDVESNLVWLGDIDDRRQIVAEFENCHVFTHPSIQDAFANVCLESMAAARPLVVSDAASMPDMVRAAQSGLIVPPEDPQALADALIHLLEDNSLREQFSQNGRTFAKAMTWQRTAERFIQLTGV